MVLDKNGTDFSKFHLKGQELEEVNSTVTLYQHPQT